MLEGRQQSQSEVNITYPQDGHDGDKRGERNGGYGERSSGEQISGGGEREYSSYTVTFATALEDDYSASTE